VLTKFRSALAAFSILGLLACEEVGPPIADTALPRLEKIAYGSCNVQLLPQTFWSQIASDNPQLFIYGGDNVYGDLKITSGVPSTGVGDPVLLKAAYNYLGAAPGFQAFRDATPIYPLWDDHDFGENGAGGTYQHKQDSEKQFLDFWAVPDEDPRRTREGIYTSSIHGPVGERVQIILLDTRYFRSALARSKDTGFIVDNKDPSTTVLGAAQWAWLEEELKREADVRLIVSSTQVLAMGHRFERWGNFPHERERLITLVQDLKANGVIFLSGDRHRAAIYALRDDVDYPIFEMTSSSLNRAYSDPNERGPLQLNAMFGKPNYATISFNWVDRFVSLEIKDMTGEVVRSAYLVIDDMQ
jgi:alkaline phosphatase D